MTTTVSPVLPPAHSWLQTARSWLRAKDAWITWGAGQACTLAFWSFMIPALYHPYGILSAWIVFGLPFLGLPWLIAHKEHHALRQQPDSPQKREKLWSLWRVESNYGVNFALNSVGVAVLFTHWQGLTPLDLWSYVLTIVGSVAVVIWYRERLLQKGNPGQGWLTWIQRAGTTTAASANMVIVSMAVVPGFSILAMIVLGLLRRRNNRLSYRTTTEAIGLKVTIWAETANLASIWILAACWVFVTLVH